MKTSALSLLVILLSVQSWATELSCRYLYAIEEGYLNQHITVRDRSGLEERMYKQYLKKLDPSKLYLHKADTDKIKSNFKGIFAKIKKKDCSPLDSIHALYLKRVKERANFAKNHLGKSFKFNKKTELVLDPDERKYPSNKKAADDFQKKYIQFQVSNYLATDMKLAEAKQNVIRGYERLVKRVKDRKSEDIYADYLDAFAHTMDPHSSFFSKDVLEDFEISMRLSLEGIGATLSSQDGFTVIEQLIPGGAAARSGKLRPKDKIIAVGQGEVGPMVNVVEEELRDVVRKIRGKKGTKVRLSILRKEGAEKSRFVVTLVRDKIKLEDEAAKLSYFDTKINGKTEKVAVLDLPSFYADSRRGGRSAAKDMKKLLLEANQKNVKGLVLDLSRNGGGSLDDAVKIAGLFFRTGSVVKQSHRDPDRAEATSLQDTDPTVNWNKPMVVLISRISASASEIVAGTLKDYKRAVVVGGDHTFGKGSVQSVVPIPQELGALKVTVGMFFIPGGDSTQHKGVDADIEFPDLYSNDEIGEKTLDYSLPPKSIQPFVSKQAYVTEGPSSWQMVEESEIKMLKEKSNARVAKDKKFKEVLEDIKKSKKKVKLVKLEEMLKEKDEKKKEDKEEDKDKVLTAEEIRAKKEKEYRERADINEAVRVLADLVELKSGQSKATTIGKKIDEE